MRAIAFVVSLAAGLALADTPPLLAASANVAVSGVTANNAGIVKKPGCQRICTRKGCRWVCPDK